MTDEKLRQEQADEEMINQGFQHLLDSYLTTKHRRKVEIITKEKIRKVYVPPFRHVRQ